MDITIRQEFKDFILPLSEENFRQLRENIIAEGCRDPLTVWPKDGENVLVDGHNRYGICTEMDLPFKVVTRDFKNKEEVKTWMIDNQLGRRNLTPEQSSYYRGLKYLKMKKKKGGYDKVIQKEKGPSTSEILADEFKVSRATIERDAQYARGLEVIGSSNPSLRNSILMGITKVKKSDIQTLAHGKGMKIKNEADLHNKALALRNQKPFQKALGIDSKQGDTSLDQLFASPEDQIKTFKARLISYVNAAIKNNDREALKDARKCLKGLETAILRVESVKQS